MKPGTFTQLHVQLVFAVRYREHLLGNIYRKEIFSYISGIVSNIGHKSLIINGYSDHVHIFLGLNPSVSISDTVSVIKKSSGHFINEKKWFAGKFQRQDGYGAFSYGKSQVPDIYNYILNQEDHHKKQTFRNEYTEVLKNEEINFNKMYLFDFFDVVDDHE
jgi:REP element-mobilizing transposase RayT